MRSIDGAFCFECGATIGNLDEPSAPKVASSEFSHGSVERNHKKKKLKQCSACNPLRNSVEIQLIASNPKFVNNDFAVHLSLESRGHSILISGVRFPVESFRRYAGAEYRALSSFERKMQGIRVLIEGYRMIPNLLTLHFASVYYGAVRHFRNLEKDADACIDEDGSDETSSYSTINDISNIMTLDALSPAIKHDTSYNINCNNTLFDGCHGIDDYMSCYSHTFEANGAAMPVACQYYVKDDGSLASNHTTSSSKSLPSSLNVCVAGKRLHNDSVPTSNDTTNYCQLPASNKFTECVDSQFPRFLQAYGLDNLPTLFDMKQSNEAMYNSFIPKLFFQSFGECNFSVERELRFEVHAA